MKELSIEEKAARYDEAFEIAKSKIRNDKNHVLYEDDIIEMFPEFKESEDERIMKEILSFLKEGKPYYGPNSTKRQEWVAWLEKQGGHKPIMIQWRGDNLKEVIDFTGKAKNFDKWFKSFEEYEEYVNDHNGIFKLFNADGSHYEIPVGAWIVKTPDGCNVASKAIFIQKPAWGEEDELMLSDIVDCIKELPIFYESININGEDKTTERFICDAINWLKHLKERYAWKPSDEQMETLYKYAEQNNYDGSLMTSLYNELKKYLL